MPRPRFSEIGIAPALIQNPPQTQYVLVRQEDVWFIIFEGEEFGPYKTEREAMLFAVDAASKLGSQGRETEVLLTDESGDARSVWRYGHNPYPPSL